ncbi:MAG: hypothetical protein RLZZ502_1479 [Pseudomonadota bacterium]|jgi:uncharacterized protein YidB (DUF937 family)
MSLLDSVIGGVINNVLSSNAGGGGGLGNILGSVLGGAGGGGAGVGGGNPLMNIAFQLMQQNGGLTGLLDMFKHGGMNQQAQSWVGTGANMGVSADQIMQVLGSGQLGALGQQFGLSPQQVGGGLANLLPELINQMTPKGNVPDNHGDMISQGLKILMGGK